jgi:aerobic carbon-monoxide dehydrogenase medium subunit
VKPAAFAYYDPTSLEEVLALLERFGDEAKLLAGGQSLIPVLNMRLAKPQVLIDLNRVAGLTGIKEAGDCLTIGAMTRHAAVERSELVARRQPLLTETIRHIGHGQIRNRGTIGGSLAHADPSAELPAAMVALEAVFTVVGPGSIWREVGAEEFFLMYFTTCLRPDELLVEIHIPCLPPRTGHAFEELARRHGDFALAGVAATLTVDEDGMVSSCRLGLTGVGMTPVRPREAESQLIGARAGPDGFRRVAEAVMDLIMPEGDIHGSAEYRRELAGVLTQRALRRAHHRAVKACEGSSSQ